MKHKSKKTKAFRSLRVTLAIAFLALSVVVLLIASSLNMYFSFQTQQELITNEQRFIAQNAADTVRSFVQEKLSELKATVRLVNLVGIHQKEQKIVLEQLLGFDPAFRQLVLLNVQNQELAKVSRLSNLVSYGFIKQIGSDLFSQVNQGETHIGSVYIDEITSEPMVVMTVPVTDVFGDFKGVLMAEVNLKFMWDLVGRIKVSDKGLAYVVDEQGNLIASGDISRVLRGENLIYLDEVNEFVKGDTLTHKESAEVVKGIQGNLVVANHAHLGTPNWAVVVELPVLEAYETVITTLIISGLIILLSFALAIIFGVFLSRRIAKPIISLRDAAVRIGEGRLDTQIEIKKEDEIGDLAAAFNQMAQDLQVTTTSIDNLNREITERKKAEQQQAQLLNQIKDSEERLKILFEHAPYGIYLNDLKGTFVDGNKAAEELIGYKKEELIGKNFLKLKLLTPKGIPRAAALLAKNVLGKPVGPEEFILNRRDGTQVILEISAFPVKIKGKTLVLGSAHDITERKKAEQQQAQLLKQLEKANQELRDFVYIISHDLKAPLRGINTVADWISTDYADKFDQEGKEQMNLLISRVDRMHNLIDGILQYSRIGRIKEEPVQVNLNELVSEVIDTLAPPENITVTIENELPVIECEKTRIMQVFQNLLSNAVKYMDKPQGQVRIGCVEENGFWKFSVADNGPGIEERYFEKIFKFFQTLSPRDEIEAVGIGLSMVKRIIEMYEGSVWVESELGNGSTFFFTLSKTLGVTDDKKQLQASSR